MLVLSRLGLLLILLLASGSGLHAQQSAEAAADLVLEEVLVTASKRDVGLQELGMSISVLSNADLRNMNATLVEEFIPAIPNVSFGYGGASFKKHF